MPKRRYRSELTRTATTLLRVAINFQPGVALKSLVLAFYSASGASAGFEQRQGTQDLTGAGNLMFDVVRRPTGAAASLVYDGAIPLQMTGQERVPNLGETQSTDLGDFTGGDGTFLERREREREACMGRDGDSGARLSEVK
ncbi:hypothetical protein C8R46DRAFT_1031593 [Mycena filopes]|nr:hypothetical protein C8R46DRAFT_1031593 [Mycena filopes]